MKAITRYQCEHCGTQYATEEAATNCEQSHKLPVSIIDARYSSIASDKTGYPYLICVEMTDSKTLAFKRKL